MRSSCLRSLLVTISPSGFSITCSFKSIVLPWVKLAISTHCCTPVGTSLLRGEKKRKGGKQAGSHLQAHHLFHLSPVLSFLSWAPSPADTTYGDGDESDCTACIDFYVLIGEWNIECSLKIKGACDRRFSERQHKAKVVLGSFALDIFHNNSSFCWFIKLSYAGFQNFKLLRLTCIGYLCLRRLTSICFQEEDLAWQGLPGRLRSHGLLLITNLKIEKHLYSS